MEWLYRISENEAVLDKVMDVMNGMGLAFTSPLPSFHLQDFLVGADGGIAIRLVVYYKAKNAKKFRHGMEYGSARWGNAKDIEPYVDPVFGNNVLLTERLMMSGRPKEPKYARNKNIDIVNIGLHFFLKNVRPYAASCSEA